MSSTAMAPEMLDLAMIAREGYDSFNNDNFDAIMTMVTDDVEIVNYSFGINMQGPEAFVQVLKMLKSPWPDLKIEIVKQITGEGFVVSEAILKGTNTEPIINPDGSQIPATGRSFVLNFCEIWQIRDGKVASLHSYSDNMSLFQQLGLVPGSAE